MSQVRKNGRQMSMRAKKVKDDFRKKIFTEVSPNPVRVEEPEVIWPHLLPENKVPSHEYLALQDISTTPTTNNLGSVVLYPKTQPTTKSQQVTAEVHNLNSEPLYEIPIDPETYV